MSVNWTKEQEKVITLRDRNLLVAAAAGSGKTAVLVERIIQKILDEKAPIDIDRILVVTFTKAAAAEMRERISLAIEAALLQKPDNLHLQRQATLIHNACITTIDSFCQSIVRNNFNEIQIDPGFRIADEGEIKLLKSDVLSEVLEEAYQKGEEAFLNFVECHSTGKSDENIEQWILKLYNCASSYPYPEEWLLEIVKQYQYDTEEAFLNSEYIKRISNTIINTIDSCLEYIEIGLAICREADGPYMYEEALISDREQLLKLKQNPDLSSLYPLFLTISYQALSRKSDKEVSTDKKEVVKALRKEVKDALEGIRKQFLFEPPEVMLSDIRLSEETVTVLIGLTLSFMSAFQTKKADKNIMDFNDLEHFALQILTKEEDGKKVPSRVADEYSEFFQEIMIDEYQDINMVQETILKSLTKERFGAYNYFMVGDIKQSIYKFRLAKPQLFMDKYESYSITESNTQKIILDQNFRSREQVLYGVNEIFNQIMRKELGSVEYDEAASLKCGAQFPDLDEDMLITSSELLIVEENFEEAEDLEGTDGIDETVDIDYTKAELEARAVAARIHNLMDTMKVYDKDLKSYRAIKYKDIVILLRSLKTTSDVFVKVLMNEGIPAFTDSKSGYFSAYEVRILLDFLRIIDNPLQDIPLAAVLKSPIGGFSGEELAIIRAMGRTESYYSSCTTYAQTGDDEGLKNKVVSFLALLSEFRDIVMYTPIHELLYRVLARTGFGDYVSAMPQGEQRKANLDMLIEKAIAFEATSYHGLFHFIRYIEYMQKYNIDYGEAFTLSENEDLVRIMSIHKSKGLEFPVCFVSGCGKLFNAMDERENLIIDAECGIGINYVDADKRVKSPTIIKNYIKSQIHNESLGEELRVLYVALTRAKEKLIVTGTKKDFSDAVKKISYLSYYKDGKIPYLHLTHARCYLDLILAALAKNNDLENIQDYMHDSFEKIKEDNIVEKNSRKVPFTITVMTVPELIKRDVRKAIDSCVEKEELLRIDLHKQYDEAFLKTMEYRFSYCYPFSGAEDLPVKVTVSQLKKQTELPEETEKLYKEEPVIPYIPEFMKENAENSNPTARGSAYHKALELMDIKACMEADDKEECIRRQLDSLVSLNRISSDAVEQIDVKALSWFYTTNLAGRLAQASRNHTLKREQPFVLGINAKEFSDRYDDTETILIQGIIDAYFWESDSYVIVDYKTDRVSSEMELIKRYRIQLDYYARALEQITGKKVKEKIIYSFALKKEIKMD